jgi:hypothetical protein
MLQIISGVLMLHEIGTQQPVFSVVFAGWSSFIWFGPSQPVAIGGAYLKVELRSYPAD